MYSIRRIPLLLPFCNLLLRLIEAVEGTSPIPILLSFFYKECISGIKQIYFFWCFFDLLNMYLRNTLM